ncbi:hypothetical protein NCCP2716_08080 [Sporosarcina sp. NCCP-2716]|uniref:MerR family transcriptional regulator n=1 Tax=Sporosarcina sp. NCCP-2716 TaxID=2943679 RepID=UPI00203F9CB6|nr:MerR family transcriptional regulator [Sporosarcina sp. NCCP-2716]GKV68310.1 hypothetical protein NCCP2716_08080 [Sporosarcina sp. NCCP-2716]
MRTEQGPQFLVSDVARLTGLSRQVIRKWEDRYRIICPERHHNGYRLYTKEDVSTLIQIRKLRDQGLSVKDAVTSYLENRTEAHPARKPLNSHVQAMLEKGASYDEAGVTLLLKQAHHKYGLEEFLTSTVQPLLTEIGDKWSSGEWDESQESITSLVIRDFLMQIRRNFELPADAPRILGCCLPHEAHEIPIQIILLQAMMNGWQTIAAGPSPKLSSIEFLVQRLKPEKVLLSAMTAIPFDRDPGLFGELEAIAARNPQTAFYLGGQGAADHAVFLEPSHVRIAGRLSDVIG